MFGDEGWDSALKGALVGGGIGGLGNMGAAKFLRDALIKNQRASGHFAPADPNDILKILGGGLGGATAGGVGGALLAGEVG